MNGAELIAAERKRQIEKEGWSNKHDSGHAQGNLALAGACYAISIVRQFRLDRPLIENPLGIAGVGEYSVIKDYKETHPEWEDDCKELGKFVLFHWPWNMCWWKPTHDDPIRQLVKAGALIAAEIDKLQAEKGD